MDEHHEYVDGRPPITKVGKQMAPKDTQTTEGNGGFAAGRRKAVRYALPVAVVGVAAATVGLVPALAASGDPDLPKISAQQLVEKIAASDPQHLAGSVKITTDLGLPSLDGLGGMGGGSFSPGGQRGGGSTSGDGSDGSSADPSSRLTELASGTHTLRVAADGPGKQRVSILENSAEYSVIHNGSQLWAYDSASNAAFHSTVPADARHDRPSQPGNELPTTPGEFADQALKAAGGTTSVSVDGTSQVAGRDAYQLLIKPKQSGSTVGSIRIAVDAKNGTPLTFTLTPSSGGKAVVDVRFTKVDFAKPAASTFDFKPPQGTKVTEGNRHDAPDVPKGRPGELGGVLNDAKTIGAGWSTVYQLDVPGGAGMPMPKPGEGSPDAQQFLNSLGSKVTGTFGSGTVYHTRLINALVTDDGKVFVGAVTQERADRRRGPRPVIPSHGVTHGETRRSGTGAPARSGRPVVPSVRRGGRFCRLPAVRHVAEDPADQRDGGTKPIERNGEVG